MDITQSGGMGFRDSDEVRVRPQPWKEVEEQHVMSLAGANAPIPTPSLTIPATQAEFEAIIAKIYADFNKLRLMS